MPTSQLDAWILTFALHSVLLGALAWLACRWTREPAARVWWLRAGILGAFATSSVAALLGSAPAIQLPPSVDRGLAPTSPIQLQAAPSQPRIQADFALESASEQPRDPRPALEAQPRPGTPIPWTWLLGLLSLGGTAALIRSEGRAQRCLADRHELSSGKELERCRALADRMGLAQAPRLSWSPRLSAPLALGAGEIVLPERALGLRPAEVEAMLAHELGHLVRRDPLWLGLARVARASLWFHPLLGPLLRRLEQDTELATDALAVRHTGEPLELARSLERVATWLYEGPRPAHAASMAHPTGGLVQRVERLVNEDPKAPRRGTWTLLLVSAALAVVACSSPRVTADGGTQPEAPATSPESAAPADTTAGEAGANTTGLRQPPGGEPARGPEAPAATSPAGTPSAPAAGAQASSKTPAAIERELLVVLTHKAPGHPVSYGLGAFETAQFEELRLEINRRAPQARSVARLRADASVPLEAIQPVLKALVDAGIHNLVVEEAADQDGIANSFGAFIKGHMGADHLDLVPMGAGEEQQALVQLDGAGLWNGLPVQAGKLELALQNVASRMRTAPMPGAGQAWTPTGMFPADRISIVANESTPMGAVLQTMEFCAGAKANIWRIEWRSAEDPEAPAVSAFLASDTDEPVEEVEISEGEEAVLPEFEPRHLSVRLLSVTEQPQIQLRNESFKSIEAALTRAGELGVTRAVLDSRNDVPFGMALPLVRTMQAKGLTVSFVGSY